MVLFMCTSKINAQYTYGTNIAQPNSIVTIQSIDSARGLKLPAVTKAKLTALPVTASMNGLIVYDIRDSWYKICNGVYWDCITQDTSALFLQKVRLFYLLFHLILLLPPLLL